MSSFSKWYLNRLPSGNYPAFLPTVARGGWNTAAFISFPTVKSGWLHPYKTNEEIQSVNFGSQDTLGTKRIGTYRLISIPLAAQTISGTLDLKIGGYEVNTAANYYLSLHLYVTAGDTDTVRGTLINAYVDNTTEFSAAGAVVSLTGIALSSTAVTAGDRLVLELGYINTSTDNVFRSGGVFIGGTLTNLDVAPDLTTDPTVQAGYIQFSAAVAVQTDPPINANVDSAIEIGLDTDTTPNLTLAPNGEVWYKHTTGASERVFGAFIWQSGLSLPHYVSWFTKPGGINTSYAFGIYTFDFGNSILVIPVQSATVYYVRTVNSATNPTNSSVSPRNIRLRTFPDLAVPDGSIYISDDTSGFGGVIVDKNTGAILKYLPDFPYGERGIQLPSGIGTFEGNAADDVVIIDNQLNVTSTITGIFTHDQHSISLYEPAVTADVDGNFYWFQYEDASNFKLTKIVSGAVTATWTIPRPVGAVGNIASIAISVDKTYLYWTLQGSNTTIYRYNLNLSSAASDFAADIATYNTIREGLLVNSDGTVYLGLKKSGIGSIRKFSSLGVDLGDIWTFTNVNYELNRIKATISPTGNVIVWVFDYTNNWTQHRFYIVDGAGNELDVIAVYAVDKGAAGNSATNGRGELSPTDPPPSYFGVSSSCTVIQTLSSTPAGTGTLIITKITIPSPDTTGTSFGFTTTGDLTPSTFNLTNGATQTYNNLPAGVYGIVETAIQGWAVVYGVSNGNPPDAIELADGETVTVTVTNTYLPQPTNALSGIYKIQPEKRDDTLWESYLPERKRLTKIPDPFADSGLLGE